jgi:serine/threonine-protein kinase
MLLGGMTLIESLPNDRTEALKSSILEYARAFLLELRMMGMPSESLELMSLGFAHGWAGILYTALRVNQIVDDADVDCVLLQIESLASLATTHDGMATIPRLNPSASDDSDTAVSWWCNGSAGYIHLFLEANSLLKHQPYLPLCQGLAKQLVTANDGPSDLCCGVAGRVYALERYARQTGDQDALLDAKRLQSFLVDQSSEFGGSPSLSKGYAGVELLNAEWKYGYCKMPFIESGCSTQRGLV